MIADIALICDSPIVLIDEIENAGIDKERALSLLQKKDKLVLVVTHDPHTALMAPAAHRPVRRRSGRCGRANRRRAALYESLGRAYREQRHYQTQLRKGACLA